MGEVIHGACLCGRIAFDVQEPEIMGACHCTRCQRWSGGSGAMAVAVAPQNFKVTKGQELMKRYQEDKFADRYFCGHCGSSIYVDGRKKYYVGAGCLRDVKLKTAYHLQVANKAPWDEIGGSAPQFAEWPSS
jgi:hypothetical protein